MSAGTAITVVGNLTADPELTFSPSGVAIVKFVVAFNPRVFDKITDEWKSGEPSFYRVVAFRQLAENVAESLTRGTRVIVSGSLSEHRWDDPENPGKKRSSWEVVAEAVGADLSYATATVKKMVRGSGQVTSEDPWTTTDPTQPASPTPPDTEPAL